MVYLFPFTVCEAFAMIQNTKHINMFLFVFALFLIGAAHGNDDPDQGSWIEPDAWSRDHLTISAHAIDKCSCLATDSFQQPNKDTKDNVAFVYYKKLISTLFDRKHMGHDAESQVFKRLLTLSVQLSQLEKLEKLDDPRDLDNLLTEIFEKSRSGVNKYQHCHIETKEASGFKYLIVDILRDLGQLVQTSEIRFLLIVTVAVLCGWFLHKRYRIGLLALFGGSLFIFGYIHTYLECNREMEVNQMIEFTKLANKQSQGNKGPNGVWGIIQRYFSSSESVQEEELLRKSTRLSLGFCRPDHVLIMYFNDIFMKYLEALIGQCTKTLLSLHENLGFPFNIIAGFLLIGLIGFIVKLVFHYTLNPAHWVHLIRPTAQFMPSPHHPLPQNNSNHVPSVDHISGENLKILLKTMNAMNAMPISKQPTNTVSGIEEVRESIEGPAERESAIVQDKETSSKVQDNNNAQKTDCKTNVLLEDLPADS